jgi:hypothetical protein
VTLKTRFTEEALADHEQLYEFAVVRGEATGPRPSGHWNWTPSAMAWGCWRNHLQLQKAAPDNTFLRELIIAFGAPGYVALFEIDGARTVTVPKAGSEWNGTYLTPSSPRKRGSTVLLRPEANG